MDLIKIWLICVWNILGKEMCLIRSLIFGCVDGNKGVCRIAYTSSYNSTVPGYRQN